MPPIQFRPRRETRSGGVRYIGQGPLEWDRIDIVDTRVELAEQ